MQSHRGAERSSSDNSVAKGIFVAKQKQSEMNEIPTDDPLLTLSEVAELFGVHRNTVSNWVAAKALPFIRTPGGMPKVRRSHVAAIIGVASSPV